MARKNYFKSKKHSLAQQKVALCKFFSQSTCIISKGKLVWKSIVRPTHLSREYNVEIRYSISNGPEVYVFGDELQKLDDKDFPHNYGVDVESKRVKICLYRYQEFSSDKLLSDTIIPWTIEWLYYYEIWLATGEWQGGGEHPNV